MTGPNVYADYDLPDDEDDEDAIEREIHEEEEYRAIYAEDSEPEICCKLWSPE